MKFTFETARELGRRGGSARTPAKRRAARANGRKRRKPHALFSSRSEEWATPAALYRRLDAEFHFTLDVCASAGNAKAMRYYTVEDDGLAQSWAGERCFMNPPYGRAIGRWIPKAYKEAAAGALVVGLIPVRTDTAWWQAWVSQGEVRFLPGRIRFEGVGASGAVSVGGGGVGRGAVKFNNALDWRARQRP